jgi:hypothetical protein
MASAADAEPVAGMTEGAKRMSLPAAVPTTPAYVGTLVHAGDSSWPWAPRLTRIHVT